MTLFSNLPIDRALPMTVAWKLLIYRLLSEGQKIAPRGQETLEIMHNSIIVDMQYPVLIEPERRLNYRFMAAEAYWILSGDNRVSTIEPYNKHIVQFSDDGVHFAGAYGPPYLRQIPFVVDILHADPSSRQATITIWQPSPEPSKDIPCTVAINFMLRDNLLHLHVFMRSSDAWLGVPYDVFNFTMMACDVASRLNQRRVDLGVGTPAVVKPGVLFLTAASSHLYGRDVAKASVESITRSVSGTTEPPLPEALYDQINYPEKRLMVWLDKLRTMGPGNAYRWWEQMKS